MFVLTARPPPPPGIGIFLFIFSVVYYNLRKNKK
jgi:hypothetical protein